MAEKKYKMATDVAFRVNKDDVVAIWKVGQMKYYYELSGISAHLWAQLNRPRNTEWLCDYVEKNFEITTAAAKKNVKSLLKSLSEKNLIKSS